MQYELTTLSCLLLEQDAVSAGAHRWVTDPGTAGRLLGAWRSEIGELGQIVVLRGFDEIDELQQERRRALMSGGPFNIGGDHVGLSMETYELFPFLPEIEPSTRGRFYEFRRYWLMPAGIAPTIAAWEQAVGPAEAYTSHLVANMYATDGPPRIAHIWGSRAWRSAWHCARATMPKGFGRQGRTAADRAGYVDDLPAGGVVSAGLSFGELPIRLPNLVRSEPPIDGHPAPMPGARAISGRDRNREGGEARTVYR